MRRKLSFRTRLLLSFWTVLLVALLLPALYYRHSLSREIVAETRSHALHQLNLVHWLLGQETEIEDADRLQAWGRRLGEQLGVRITYVAEGGRVIADSRVAFAEIPRLDNHATRPEIVQAFKEGLGTSIRYSATLERNLLYLARRTSARGAIPAGIIRVAVPFSLVKDRLDRLTRSFIFIVAVTFVASILLSYALVRQLENPVRSMIRTAEAIGSGDYGQRIRLDPGREFSPLARSINRMAERIETHIRNITAHKEQLEAILNGMTEGVMVLDSKGKIQAINHALAVIVPDPAASIGRRPLEVIRSPELQHASDRVLADEDECEHQPCNLQITTEGERVFDVSIVRFRDQQGGRGAIVVFHDISELKRLEKVRKDFVANVSHELRTPLTSVKGYAETLLSDNCEDSNAVRSFLQVILKNANHMTKMVDDLLQLARLEAHIPVAVAPINAVEPLLSAWKACASLAGSKNIHLENALPEEGIQVLADYDQLLQVFRNLLENAIKYSPAGATVGVSCHLGAEVATFQVRDRGPGIPKQDQTRIFERFYRVGKDRRSNLGSTGLGLAISRHIIRNCGGRIWVESPPKGETTGSAFFFTLPLAPGEPASS
jgi:two-component system phosphate regulon sensor histidine kinase PhoR